MTDVAMFDLDGTLVDSPQGIVETFAASFEALGVEPRDASEVRATIGLPLPRAFCKLLGAKRGDTRVAAGVAHYREAFPSIVLPRARSLVFPGVAEGLAELRGHGVALAVATSKFRSSAEALLEAAGLRSHFEIVVAADDVTHPKPHPESGQVILERLGARPHQAVMTGDTTHDVLMAQAAGLRSTAVTYGVHAASELAAAGPSQLADTFPEVVAYILQGLPAR